MQSYIDFTRALDLAAYRRGETPSELTLTKGHDLFVSYAPFDHIATRAELVLVGLTPGRTQAANALEALQAYLKAGRDLQVALAAAKSTASFSGSMRSSLIAMLDQVGVAPVVLDGGDPVAVGRAPFDRGGEIDLVTAMRLDGGDHRAEILQGHPPSHPAVYRCNAPAN